MKSVTRAIFAGAAACAAAMASAQTVPSTDKEKFSYSLGFQVGTQLNQQLSQQGMDLDAAAFAQAVEDVLNGIEPRLSMESMDAALRAEQAKMQQARASAGEDNRAAGDAYRAANRDKEGVSETPSGVQYRVITAGEGKQPAATDTVVVHYAGTLVNGEEFDSSYARGQPATFSLNGIIPGWQEVLQLMAEGAKWEVVIPPQLAYGAQGAGDAIGPNETLVFVIELIEVK